MKNYRSIHKSIPFSFVINKSEFIGNCKFVETEEEALEFVGNKIIKIYKRRTNEIDRQGEKKVVYQK